LKSQYFQELFEVKNLNIFKSLPDSWKNGETPEEGLFDKII